MRQGCTQICGGLLATSTLVDWPKPYPGWKDPYAKLDKTTKAKPKTTKTKAKSKS